MARKRQREVGYESTVKETFAAEQTAPCTETLAAEVAGTDRLAAGCRSPENPQTPTQQPDRPCKPKRGPPPEENRNDTPAAVPGGPVNPILDLGERLTIAKAGEIKERLAAFLQVPAAFLVVDGSRVAAVDTAGLQLLTVFCHEMHERGIEVLWRGASAILRHGAATLGLVKRLRLHEL
ncbi:MAG: lipid asymmetry maintenance protein MlaB [Chromatiales bacterium]